ncbi:MAG: hypothetical protein KA765_03665 [Thermoflexales bacterium]|nr:hypothetical protein [Thermoflexales bacterium]
MHAIRIAAESQGCHITACYLPLNSSIRGEGDLANHTISGNYYRDGTVADVETP